MFVAQDEKLKVEGKAISGFYAIHYDNLIKPLTFNKYFLQDALKNNIAIMAHASEVTDKELGNTIIKLMKYDPVVNQDFGKKQVSHYFLKETYPALKLSKRQTQCLFYILRGKSASKIAKMLGLSTRTVESYIENLKDKMLCNNKEELIESAFKRGYFQIIPSAALNFSLSDFNC
jgi:DNA-binding CsgD family transcriptional regulator